MSAINVKGGKRGHFISHLQHLSQDFCTSVMKSYPWKMPYNEVLLMNVEINSWIFKLIQIKIPACTPGD